MEYHRERGIHWSKMNVVVVLTSPANIRGIIRLHGEILPVFSLASRFGLGNIAVDNSG